MSAEQEILDTFYRGWEEYQRHLVEAIAPLTAEQLTLRPAPHLRSIGANAAHIVTTRARWFRGVIGEQGENDEIAQIAEWVRPGTTETPALTASELVHGLEVTWRMIREALGRWSPEEMARTFERSRGGKTYTFTRQWIVWHLIEHDLHHGGELSFTLGMHGLAAPEM